MKQQLIFETKVKLIDYVFQNRHLDYNNHNSESIPYANNTNLLDSMLVINDSKNISSGTIILDKLVDLNFKYIGNPDTEYSLLEIKANYPIILNFAVEEKEISMMTSSFSYNNPEIKLKNIQVLNSTLRKNIENNTYTSVESSNNIELRFLLIEQYNLKYTTFGDFYV